MSQNSVEELLRRSSGFGRYMQEGSSSIRQKAVISSDSRNQRAEIKRLRDQLDSAEAADHKLRYQVCIA